MKYNQLMAMFLLISSGYELLGTILKLFFNFRRHYTSKSTLSCYENSWSRILGSKITLHG